MTKRLPQTATFDERFWHRVDRSGDCWPWTGYTDPGGYGRVKPPKGAPVLAHRAAWELTNGPIPGGQSVLHRCDNPPCCNPAHLFVGTIADNNADCRAKGRHKPHGNLKLSDKEIAAIVRRYRPGPCRSGRGANTAALASEFGISERHVTELVRRHRFVAGETS